MIYLSHSFRGCVLPGLLEILLAKGMKRRPDSFHGMTPPHHCKISSPFSGQTPRHCTSTAKCRLYFTTRRRCCGAQVAVAERLWSKCSDLLPRERAGKADVVVAAKVRSSDLFVMTRVHLTLPIAPDARKSFLCSDNKSSWETDNSPNMKHPRGS